VKVPEQNQKSERLMSSQNVTAVAHFYRGEMARSNIWRSRLDVTTNWAIITSGAFLSFGFGHRDVPHFVFIIATIFVLFFLIIEARRYKYFDLWRWRVALVNENYFAGIFSPDKPELIPNWQELLSEDLRYPRFKINFSEAFGRRLRRNYIWVFQILAICWVAKISIHPTPTESFATILERAHIYHFVPGAYVLAVGVCFNLFLILVAILTIKKREEIVRIYPSAKSNRLFRR
jgi:uncharacterized membrane protein